jgi:hypothetical protein
MISENAGQSLHDKATWGGILTDNEQILLYDCHRMKSKPKCSRLTIFSRKQKAEVIIGGCMLYPL